MMQLIFGVVWLLLVHGGITRTAGKETTTNSYWGLELQDSTNSDSLNTSQIYDIEENKTLNPPSLENDTYVNYVKNISEDKLAEMAIPTQTPIEITTIPFSNLDSSNDNLEISSDFDHLTDDLEENLSLFEKSTNDKNTTERNADITSDEVFAVKNSDDNQPNDTNQFQDDPIYENVIMNRVGLAADYIDDYKDQEKSKISSWKPVWPFAAFPGYNSTPLPTNNPRTIINKEVSSVKLFRDPGKTVSKEPVTAYYFDITNTPLPSVGPLYDPVDVYGSEGIQIANISKDDQYFSNKSLFRVTQNISKLGQTEQIVIETTPVVSLSSIKDLSKLSNNVYTILNDEFDQDREEFSVTFSTLLPSIKEIMPTMAADKLLPKRVTDSKISVMTLETGIQSSKINIQHKVTTVLNSQLAHAPVTPVMSVSNVKSTKIRTPLWVRLSGQASSPLYTTITNPNEFHISNIMTAPLPTAIAPLPTVIAPSPKKTSIIPTYNIAPALSTSENILLLHTTQKLSLLTSKESQKTSYKIKALTISEKKEAQDITSTNKSAIRDLDKENFSSLNNSSTSYLAHSTSNSISDISISEKEVGTNTKPMKFDANFVLQSSMRHQPTSIVPTETPIITPTKSMTIPTNLLNNKPVIITEPETSTDSNYATSPESAIVEKTSVDSIIKDNLSSLGKPNRTKTPISRGEQRTQAFDINLVQNINGTFEGTSENSTNISITTENGKSSTEDVHSSKQHINNHQTTELPTEESTKSLREEESQDEYEDSGAQISNISVTGFTSTTTEKVMSIPTKVENTISNNNARHQSPGEMKAPNEVTDISEYKDKDNFSTQPSILLDDENMIKTVIKHLPGKPEPELNIIEMHSNGTTISKPSPYVKAAVSYGLQDFCRHQGNIRSLLGEWVNNHLKNETDSASYEIQFFAQPNCSNLAPLPKNITNSKTVLYFYVMDESGINPNVTRQYPKNPTNLEISQKLAYLKEKILHLELVNAITYSEDLALEEAAVGTSILAVIISTVILLFFVIFAVFTFMIIKRRRANDQSHGRRCTPAANDTYSMDSVSVFYNSFRRKSKKRASNKSVRSYLNQGFEDPNGPSRPLNFGKLTHFISDTEGIYDEFLKIPSVTPKYDEMPKGVEDKNRYANVIPMPETRVFLKTNVQTPVEEYINANYIHGTRGEAKYYIAAQAPLDETVPDFWQMIWEQESKVIVMLTDFVEKGIDKCADYLPPSETLDCHRVYGDFQVTLKSRDMREKYVVSQVQLKNLENNLVREIAHMWFTGWPYSGIPNEEKSFISYIFETRAMRKKLRSKGPIVVHCSPGTGRSGTFIACDISMRSFDDQKCVDIPKTVWKIRRERAGAVQTKEQYAFIYRVTNLYAAKLMTGNLDLF